MSNFVTFGTPDVSVQKELEQLFRQHYQMLYRTAHSILDNRADAEDVPQTIFLRLLRSGMTPDLQRNPAGYLYRAAVNLSLNIIRSRKRQAVPDDAREHLSPADASDTGPDEEMDRRLANAIRELDPETAQILILRYLHDYSDSRIARLLGTSRGAIAMRLLRARARLRKLIHSSLGDMQ